MVVSEHIERRFEETPARSRPRGPSLGLYAAAETACHPLLLQPRSALLAIRSIGNQRLSLPSLGVFRVCRRKTSPTLSADRNCSRNQLFPQIVQQSIPVKNSVLLNERWQNSASLEQSPGLCARALFQFLFSIRPTQTSELLRSSMLMRDLPPTT